MDRTSKQILKLLKDSDCYQYRLMDVPDVLPIDYDEICRAVDHLEKVGKIIVHRDGLTEIELSHESVHPVSFTVSSFFHWFFHNFLCGFISGLAVSVTAHAVINLLF